ncbi:hypothetical protein AB6A40_001873 [Gnathostoma spinigerum]|uniref:RYYR-CCHC domain-containing protein n=1 Tax=Gnathostoma spinigerum TaxID=75299 RepID=A0ABD6E585_9BILA
MNQSRIRRRSSSLSDPGGEPSSSNRVMKLRSVSSRLHTANGARMELTSALPAFLRSRKSTDQAQVKSEGCEADLIMEQREDVVSQSEEVAAERTRRRIIYRPIRNSNISQSSVPPIPNKITKTPLIRRSLPSSVIKPRPKYMMKPIPRLSLCPAPSHFIWVLPNPSVSIEHKATNTDILGDQILPFGLIGTVKPCTPQASRNEEEEVDMTETELSASPRGTYEYDNSEYPLESSAMLETSEFQSSAQRTYQPESASDVKMDLDHSNRSWRSSQFHEYGDGGLDTMVEKYAESVVEPDIDENDAETVAIKTMNVRGNPHSLSIVEPNGIRTYRLSQRRGTRCWYRCSACDRYSRRTGLEIRPRIATLDGAITGSAHPRHHVCCKPLTSTQFRAKQIDLMCRNYIRLGKYEPREAWTKGREMAASETEVDIYGKTASAYFPEWKRIINTYSRLKLQRGRAAQNHSDEQDSTNP